MSDNGDFHDEDSGNEALIAAAKSQNSGRGNLPPPYASYAFPMQQPTEHTQWSQTQTTLIPTQTQLERSQFALPPNVGNSLAGLPSGISNAQASAMCKAPLPATTTADRKGGGSRKARSK
eukprot:scaffold3492_cov99-Amphora_coffeaeformis.AAC.2